MDSTRVGCLGSCQAMRVMWQRWSGRRCPPGEGIKKDVLTRCDE